MIRLLESVPWFVIAAFGAAALLAIAAGRGRSSGSSSGEARALTRGAALVYAVAAAVIIGLWMREQF